MRTQSLRNITEKKFKSSGLRANKQEAHISPELENHTHNRALHRAFISVPHHAVQHFIRLKLNIPKSISNFKLSINNLSGEVLFMKSYQRVDQNFQDIDVSEFPCGMYFVRYADDENTQSIQVIKG